MPANLQCCLSYVVQNRLDGEAQVGVFPALPGAGQKRGQAEGRPRTVAIMEGWQRKVAKKTVLAPDRPSLSTEKTTELAGMHWRVSPITAAVCFCLFQTNKQ